MFLAFQKFNYHVFLWPQFAVGFWIMLSGAWGMQEECLVWIWEWSLFLPVVFVWTACSRQSLSSYQIMPFLLLSASYYLIFQYKLWIQLFFFTIRTFCSTKSWIFFRLDVHRIWLGLGFPFFVNHLNVDRNYRA